jgi:hypothetical protein
MEKIIGLIGCLLLAGAVAATPEEDHADAIRVLGVTNIVVKNPGYFFYGGEYVPPPYTVTREGDFLKINGRYIRFFCKWPPPKLRKWHVTHKMPEVPPSVTETTSEFDPVVRNYMDDCFDFWLTTHAADDQSFGATVMVVGMLKLPCVKDAYVDECGDVRIGWTDGRNSYGVDYSAIADNPSCWDPPPVDSDVFRLGGDEAAADLAEEISNGRYLFWPLKNGGPWLTGSNLEPEFDKVLKNIDKCATAEALSTACGWYPYRVELCADLLKHKDSFDAGLRKRINKRVAEIEAEKRAEREREEMEAAERKRAAEGYAKRKAAELEPTVKWTPENARKGGVRFYAFYKGLRYSGEPYVPYAFWPRSTQPGDKWKYRLRENSMQALKGFFGGNDAENTRILEDIAAGSKRVKGQLRPDTIQWSISCDFPVAKDDPAAYVRIPMLVSANLNPAYLLREWDGEKDADKVIPLGPKSGAEKSLFGDACAVIVFNDGTGETIPAKELTYARIYRRAFKGPPLLGYLTVRGYVEPKGLQGSL